MGSESSSKKIQQEKLLTQTPHSIGYNCFESHPRESFLLTLSSCHPLDADPPQSEHGAVVVDVQESDLVEFFPQNKKHRVQILNAL